MLSGLQSLLSGLTSILGAPFRLVRSGINALAPLQRMQRSFGAIGRLLTAPLRLIGIKTGGGDGERTGFREWWDSLPIPGRKNLRRTRVSERAQFSQIHLIGGEPDALVRMVVHIGTIIGRSAADLSLSSRGYPILLRFIQADPAKTKAPMMMEYVAGSAKILVNGQELTDTLPINSTDFLLIDDDEYSLELYAWDKVPIVTRVDAGFETTTGGARENNEDAIGIYQHPKAYLFAVADGVGGGHEGEQIAAYAIQYLLSAFHKNVEFTLPWTEILKRAYISMNTEVRTFAEKTPRPTGSTLTSVVIQDWMATVAHVGDSRLYHWRNGIMTQLTNDHMNRQPVEWPTQVAATALEAPPLRDVLTRAIGKNDVIEPDIFQLPIQPGDRLVLMSDGVTKHLKDPQIARIISANRASRAAAELIERTEAAGAIDNASVLCIDVLEEAFVEDTWTAQTADRIFTGWRSGWPKKLVLSKEGDLNTQVPGDGRGCLTTLAFVITLLIIWFILRPA
jgi:protein phosphatase